MKKIFLFIFLFPVIKIYADEINTNSNLIELKIPIQQNLKNEPTIKTIKIDDNTEAKITISSEKIDTKKMDFLKNDIIALNNKIESKTEEYKKNNLVVEKEKNIPTQQEIVKKTSNTVNLVEDINIGNKKTEQKIEQVNNKVQKKANNNENNNDKTLNQEITIKGDYKNNQQSVIKIKDGARNININFQPNIITSNKQQKQVKGTKKTKNISKNNVKRSKIKSGVIIVKDKDEKKKDTTTKNVEKKNVTTLTNDVVAKDEEKKENTTTPVEKANLPEKENNVTKNDKKEEEKQNIYIINRIINLDENSQLTDEIMKSISIDDEDNNKQIIKVGNNNKNSLSAYSQNDNKFKQKYDLMVENTIPYGEVAFVEDYNS